MDLGQKIKQARLEAGLSQRALCGDTITRNMLSQIENGTAKPSVETLQFLAEGLGKPVGYFLDPEPASENQGIMAAARAAFEAGDFAAAAEALEAYRAPDRVFDWEYKLLLGLALLHLAEQALKEGKKPYALGLLDRAEALDCPYLRENWRGLRQKLTAQLRPEAALENVDELLFWKAAEALRLGQPHRAGALLEGAQAPGGEKWQLLRGQAYFAAGDYSRARAALSQAEAAFPGEAVPLLEQCCAALGDYKGAYEYACKQK